MIRGAGSVLTVALALAACSPDADRGGQNGQIIDDAGRVHAPTPPRTRVVSLIPAVTETLIAMGAADRLVARTRYDEAPDLAHLPSVGGGLDPSLEYLAELSPELVVAWASGAGRATLGDALDEFGVAWYGAAVQTIADFERHAAQLGLLVGLDQAADSIVGAVRDGLRAVRESWAGRTPIRVAYVVQAEPFMTVGPGTFLDSVMAVAGAENVFRDLPDGWPLVTMEEVVLRDPEYVVLPSVVSGTPDVPPGGVDPGVARLSDRPAWRAVRAVREGRVLSVDGSLFGRPGPRMGEAARYLSERLHGGR
ncbi:MAG: ABC transporter substrate-binding protein [Gemmatimonadetes bacterium]|nr:ABC transporter substrate-binding protein [Gemmatimonadota bacterium]